MPAAANGMAAWVSQELGGSPLAGVDEMLWLKVRRGRVLLVMVPTCAAAVVPCACLPAAMLVQATTELGCGFAQCPNIGGLVVCNYNPPGNIGGSFQANV